MTDREKLRAVIETFSDRWEEKPHSITIFDSKIRLIFTPEGEIKSVIRQGQRYGVPVPADFDVEKTR